MDGWMDGLMDGWMNGCLMDGAEKEALIENERGVRALMQLLKSARTGGK